MFGGYFKEARLTLLLAIPMMAGQFSQMVMGLVDTLMVGRVGVLPLASAAFAQNVLSFFFIIGVGLQIPVSILAAQAHGAGAQGRAGEILRHGLWIGFCSGVGIVICLLLASFFLQHFGQELTVAEGARGYLRILAWSLLPAMIELNLQQFCQALGRPWTPMAISIGAVCANAFLNWVLIYGNLGCKAQGLNGAAWATLLCRMCSCAGLLVVVVRGSHWQAELPRSWRNAFQPGQISAMLRLGLPISFSLLLEVAAFGMAALMMGWINARTLAAHQIAMTCAAMTFMIPLGLSFAVSIRIGHAVGAQERERLAAIGFSAMGLAALVMGTAALIFTFFGMPIARLFVKDDSVVMLAGSLLAVAGIFQLFDGWQVVLTGALRGLADVKVPTAAAFCAYWLIALPLAYWLGFVRKMDGLGVWWALAAGLCAAAVFALARFAWMTSRIPGAIA